MESGSKRVLVTGGLGFVGRNLTDRLEREGFAVRRTVRSASADRGRNVVRCDLRSDRGWRDALAGVESVVHLAGTVHVTARHSPVSLDEFREVNRDGTLRLVEWCRRVGVRRLVFASTIKVLGESTRPGNPFRADDPLNPGDDYAVSKAEAEEGIMKRHEAGDIEIAVVRPPLVYGPGAAGNLARLEKIIRRGIPLPLGALENRRDMVGVENLCDLIATLLRARAAPGKRFLVSDGEPVATPTLIRAMAAASGRRVRLVNVPPSLLEAGFRMAKREEIWDRLAGNLEVDVAETRRRLGWVPPRTFEDGIRFAYGTPRPESNDRR